MRAIPSLLSLLTSWTLSSSNLLHLGPGLLMNDLGEVTHGEPRALDPVWAFHLLGWQILCEALREDPAEQVLFTNEDVGGELIFAERRLDESGRWLIDIGGGDLDDLVTLGAGDDLWHVLERAGADLWYARQCLRRWARREGIEDLELPEETVITPSPAPRAGR